MPQNSTFEIIQIWTTCIGHQNPMQPLATFASLAPIQGDAYKADFVYLLLALAFAWGVNGRPSECHISTEAGAGYSPPVIAALSAYLDPWPRPGMEAEIGRMKGVKNPTRSIGPFWKQWVLSRRQCQADYKQMLPSFFIIGPPRTGTSWIHQVLRQRAILPKLTKETRFFDTHFNRGLNWYRAHFPRPVDNLHIGEVAPTYFASPEARQRIKQLVPNAKIVCIFRDPVDRVLSLYRVKRAYGMIPWTFEQAILQDPELTESSRYATYLKAWQQDFGAEHVLATIYDDLRDQPQSFVNMLADFLEIPRFSLSRSEMKSVHASESMTHPRSYYRTRSATMVADWLKARRFGHFVSAVKKSPISKFFLGGGLAFSGISREVSITLQELFQEEVEELESMVQRDLSAWKPFRNDLHSNELPSRLDDGSPARA